MKIYYFFLLFFSGILQAQQIKVVDAENGDPISGARIVLSDQILYTNDDGIAPVEHGKANFEVSASGFQTQKLNSFTSLIKLAPVYKEIEEVSMMSVDIRKIFEDIDKNYDKRYFNQPSLYDVVYKEKKIDNNKLHFLTIAEAKLWSKSNQYNFKDGYHKKYDNIIQMQLNNVKYLKTLESDSIFTGRSNEFSHEYIGNFFFNFELNRILANMKVKDSKYSGLLVFENKNEQVISFKINTNNASKMKGTFKYNKADKVITYFEITYLQTDFPLMKRKTTDGREYEFKLGDATLMFDFYKKDEGYIPALNRIEGDNFIIYYNGKKHVKKFYRELVYNTFARSDKKGLESKVDFNKDIWENVPVKETKDITLLLSADEQEFLNQK
ncbi:hypothetical protein CHRYSEOSP005_08220 [Chryseobacterium sp. Alg-005]|uniref:carboxypeptidase-like regulatory domain-containing protein n=1 Tax=Chryseobacterium sp. Alg-005 TaxID=3159516 RepID=UPI003555A902